MFLRREGLLEDSQGDALQQTGIGVFVPLDQGDPAGCIEPPRESGMLQDDPGRCVVFLGDHAVTGT